MQPKLGILAGGGPLPKYLTDHCRQIGRECYVLQLLKNANAQNINDVPGNWVRIGAAGKIIKQLRKQNVKEVVMVGHVRRPSIINVFPDWGGIKFLIKVGMGALGGDNTLLSAVAKELEREGFKVVGIDEILLGLLATSGPFGKFSPSDFDRDYIQHGIEHAQTIGRKDKGQAVVIQKNDLIGTEDKNGTDHLIIHSNRASLEIAKPILIKIKKPGQDRRVDLPTIGPRTVELAARYGFAGIVVESGHTLVIDKNRVTKIADRSGMFVIGVTIEDAN